MLQLQEYWHTGIIETLLEISDFIGILKGEQEEGHTRLPASTGRQLDIGHGKPLSEVYWTWDSPREIFRYICYQFNELGWNLLIAAGRGGTWFDTLNGTQTDQSPRWPGVREDTARLFIFIAATLYSGVKWASGTSSLSSPGGSWPRKLEAEGTCQINVRHSATPESQ